MTKKISLRHTCGSIMAEYMVVLACISIVTWLAIFGGSGDWRDVDKTPNHGASLMGQSTPSYQAAPSLLKGLNDKQDSFSQNIYQP